MHADPSSPDFYRRLGVSEDATDEELRAAWKAVRKELHPDGKPDALVGHYNAMSQNVTEAYQTLTRPAEKAKYLRNRARGTEHQQHQPPPYEEPPQEAHQPPPQDPPNADEARKDTYDEDADWSDVWDEAWTIFDEAAGDPEESRQAESQPGAPGGIVQSGVLNRLPGPVHRLAIYTAGSWLWLLAAVVTWNLPFWGAEAVAVLFALVVPVVAGGILFLTMKAAIALSAVERAVGFLMPTQGRFTAIWFSRRVIESAVIAPLFILLATVFSGLWGLLSLGAIVYVVLWAVEFFRWRAKSRG